MKIGGAAEAPPSIKKNIGNYLQRIANSFVISKDAKLK